MFTRPPDLNDADVVAALERGWHLAVDEAAYLPIGFGSHHWIASADGRSWFVTVDDLDMKRSSETDTRAAAWHRLTAAMQTAWLLQDSGLDFVAAPIIGSEGNVSESIDSRFALSLFDHVDGETHTFGAYPTRTARLAVLERLAALHRVCLSSTPALEERFEVPRREITALTSSLGADQSSGPYTVRASKLLMRHRDSLAGAFDRFESMVKVANARRGTWVITHGEPHRANTIDTPNRGVVLIDWDTVLVAPPERDLWSLISEDEDIEHEYTRLTGRTVNRAIIELYELFWDLTEVCLYAAEFLAPHERTADTEVAWESFQRYLDPSRWAEAP